MEYQIRLIKEEEIKELDDFLYDAIFQPSEAPELPREIIYESEIYAYIEEFGKRQGDFCLVAVCQDELIGAVWTRILSGEVKGYGNIDGDTPEFAISVKKAYRGKGIATSLIQEMLGVLKGHGYKQASLAVQKANFAQEMYKKAGFEIVGEDDQEYIMEITL